MRAEREYLNRVPVTPKESAAWFGRLLSCFWGPFVEPMLLKTAIVPLQVRVTLRSWSVFDSLLFPETYSGTGAS